MKALILYSSSSFPLAALAGAIYLKKIAADQLSAGLWDLSFIAGHAKYSLGRMFYLGKDHHGYKVVAFSAPSGRIILKNLIETFLEMNSIGAENCRVIEIRIPVTATFWAGRLLLMHPLFSGAGRRLLTKYVNKIYPQLASAVQT